MRPYQYQIVFLLVCLVHVGHGRRIYNLFEENATGSTRIAEALHSQFDGLNGEYNSTAIDALATGFLAFNPPMLPRSATQIPWRDLSRVLGSLDHRSSLFMFQNTLLGSVERRQSKSIVRANGVIGSEITGDAKSEESAKENEKWKGPSPPPSPSPRNRKFRNVFYVLAGGWATVKALAKKKRPLPVVLVHGILDTAANMEGPARWIRNALGKGSYVRPIEVGNGEVDSISKPMEWQLARLAEQIQSDQRLLDGFNMVGYSQGSLLARGYVQRYDSPRCHVLVSWVGPQAGQYGVPSYEPLLGQLNHITSGMWYTPYLQSTVSFSNYWRDPTRLDLYEKQSAFLADLNNEREHKNSEYAKRIARLDHFVLLHSTTDQIIQPSVSSWFGFFKDNSTTEIVPLHASKLYTEDRIGLRSLDRAGRLHFETCTCSHNSVPQDKCKVQVFDKATRRYLMPERAGTSLMRWLRVQRTKPRRKEEFAERTRQALEKTREEFAGRTRQALEKERERVRSLQTELDQAQKRAAKAESELQKTR